MALTLLERMATTNGADGQRRSSSGDRPSPIEVLLESFRQTVEAIDLLESCWLTSRIAIRELPEWATPPDDLLQIEKQMASRMRSLDCVRDRIAAWPRG